MPGPLLIAKRLAAGAYAQVQQTRSTLYARNLLTPSSAAMPCLSVGGLEVGGVGKTPICALLLRAMLAENLRCGLLSRGYKRRRRGLVVRRTGAPACALDLGDEAAMLVMQGLDVPMAISKSRIDGARALEALGCELALLDDGFAHRALRRDVDIVVLRGEEPLANEKLLPLGPLREPPRALARADVLWLHFRRPPATPERIAAAERLVRQHNPHAPIVVSEAWPAPARSATGESLRLAGRAVVGVAATARPAEFERALKTRGAQVAGFVGLPDHYRFGPRDVDALVELAGRLNAALVITTPKDFVKLHALWPEDGPPLGQAGLTLDVISGHRSFAELTFKRLRITLKLPPPRQALGAKV